MRSRAATDVWPDHADMGKGKRTKERSQNGIQFKGASGRGEAQSL